MYMLEKCYCTCINLEFSVEMKFLIFFKKSCSLETKLEKIFPHVRPFQIKAFDRGVEANMCFLEI
jgi:hypothetical protein